MNTESYDPRALDEKAVSEYEKQYRTMFGPQCTDAIEGHLNLAQPSFLKYVPNITTDTSAEPSDIGGLNAKLERSPFSDQ